MSRCSSSPPGTSRPTGSKGLVAGGDDYVTKPFTLAEVVARVHAILRRTRGETGGDTALRFVDLVMEEDTREVWRGNDTLQLTATEFNLLRFFMRNPKRVLSKAQILDAVWHYDFGGNPNVVETYVSYLRKKRARRVRRAPLAGRHDPREPVDPGGVHDIAAASPRTGVGARLEPR